MLHGYFESNPFIFSSFFLDTVSKNKLLNEEKCSYPKKNLSSCIDLSIIYRQEEKIKSLGLDINNFYLKAPKFFQSLFSSEIDVFDRQSHHSRRMIRYIYLLLRADRV